MSDHPHHNEDNDNSVVQSWLKEMERHDGENGSSVVDGWVEGMSMPQEASVQTRSYFEDSSSLDTDIVQISDPRPGFKSGDEVYYLGSTGSSLSCDSTSDDTTPFSSQLNKGQPTKYAFQINNTFRIVTISSSEVKLVPFSGIGIGWERTTSPENIVAVTFRPLQDVQVSSEAVQPIPWTDHSKVAAYAGVIQAAQVINREKIYHVGLVNLHVNTVVGERMLK